jgi:hypothetical protein
LRILSIYFVNLLLCFGAIYMQMKYSIIKSKRYFYKSVSKKDCLIVVLSEDRRDINVLLGML